VGAKDFKYNSLMHIENLKNILSKIDGIKLKNKKIIVSLDGKRRNIK